MNTIKLVGYVDEQHHLSAEVPASIAPGRVELVLFAPSGEEDDAGREWAAGIAREWMAELSDPREDIYTLEDGEPIEVKPS
jgi:hypothetical protein